MSILSRSSSGHELPSLINFCASRSSSLDSISGEVEDSSTFFKQRENSLKRQRRKSHTRDAVLCCGPVVPLWERLFLPASITTMEKKYGVCTFVAEWWCTLTSPFFALPLLIYLFIPFSAIPPLQHACIAGSVIAGLISTIYHATLWKLFSSADAAVATATFYLNAISLNRHGPFSHPLLHLELPWIAVTLVIVLLHIYHWEKTHHVSVTLVLACVPAALFGFYALESYVGLVSGVVGLICFVVDRKGWACLHWVWHVLGGVSLLFGIWDACEASCGGGWKEMDLIIKS